MAPKNSTKGGFGHRDALDFVDQLRRAGMSVVEIRAQLKANGYSKSRVSQLCPLHEAQDGDSAPSASVAPSVETCSKRHILCYFA